MTTTKRTRLIGYGCAIAAGSIWGTTGPLSTALYAEGTQISAVGFWRILLATLGFIVYGLFARDLFRIDRRGILLVAGLGGALVALFEVPFQYAIAGLGVAPAVALLYTAPVVVAIVAHFLLGEALTPLRVALAVMVMIGVALAVNGAVAPEGEEMARTTSRFIGLLGGVLAAASYAGTTILARFAVPRYGSIKFLFWELVGGTLILAVILPLLGKTPAVPTSMAQWTYVALLGIGAVLAANFFFFAAVKRIDAAPTAVGASVEPVVGALLALLLFNQQLYWFGWLGIAMIVAGVSGGAVEEQKAAAS